MIDLSTQRYAFLELASAALFGLSTPLAKLLLGHAGPPVLAGLLYLGSGLGLLLVKLAQRSTQTRETGAAAHTSLRRCSANTWASATSRTALPRYEIERVELRQREEL